MRLLEERAVAPLAPSECAERALPGARVEGDEADPAGQREIEPDRGEAALLDERLGDHR